MDLFTNEQSGVISCSEHAGHYFAHALEERPKARRWSTPLGVWRRWTKADAVEWEEFFPGKPAKCETCGGTE